MPRYTRNEAAIAALNAAEPLMPRRVYAPGPLPAGFPAWAADEELPHMLLPVDGFPKLEEFWSSMGKDQPLKPVVYLVVTIPVRHEPQTAGVLVTTRTSDWRLAPEKFPLGGFSDIGGAVLDGQGLPPGTPPRPVPGARVALEDMAGNALQSVAADGQGRFLFGRLAPGDYRIRVQAPGLGETLRQVAVPSGSGEYDVVY